VRADLREEFDMADEAFALSPISARATLPSEEDYAAIAEAFMETSRGRWFLTEYAKRNRNADTRMVLDAVARIEQSLVAQREENLEREASLQRDEGLSAQQAAEAVAAAAAAQERLTEALAAIRSSVEAAEESAVEALDSLALEQRLAPVRKGARVLREIAWRLREIGNDGRICDLIDSQVTVIEKGTDQFSSVEARAGLRAAFAALQGRLVEFGDEEHASSAPVAETAAAVPSSATAEMPSAAVHVETVLPQQAAAASSASPANPAEAAPAAAAALPAQTEAPPAAEVAAAEESTALESPVQEDAVQNATQDNEAEDEAVLDMIAMEMGAPDPINDDEIMEAAVEQARLVEPAPITPAAIAEAPKPVAASAPPPVQQAVQAQPPAAAPLPPAPVPAVEVSLGSTLIASGMLRKPVTPANDPLAPIRRMSQAEKIAFFS
jgi:hypothetical protein